ncbi:MAG: molybdopterin molybdenumtransferase MoeA, partial [Candidatus Poribacteria bacterium]|nr:molybdopterin molybdenumtransferase MoeA [Candidatus Poribacteria bacterium]
IKNDTNRVNFMRAIIEKHNGKYHAKITGDQGSGILYSLVLANGLITIPVNQTIHAGETVDAQFFGDAF